MNSRPLGYCASQVDSPNSDSREQNLLSLSYGNIVRKDIAGTDGLLPESFETYNVVEPGDTVLRLTDLQNDQRSLRVGFVQERGIVTSAYVTLRPQHDVDPRFFSYVLKSMDFRKDFYALGAGVRQSLKFDELKRVQIHLPAFDKQRDIADYLDTETARIDALIKKKRQMIELVQERLAVKVDALLGTAGSGIRLKYCVKLLPGYAFSSEDFSTDASGPRLLRGINVTPGAIVWDETVRLVDSVPEPSSYRVEAGDVVLGMDRPFVASGTRVAVVDSSAADSLLVQRVCRLRTSSSSAAVLVSESLRSSRFRAYVEMDLSGVSVPHLSDEQIGNFIVPDVVARGSDDVVNRVLETIKANQQLVDCLSSQLALLRERRQALITAAVTGELEVSEMEA